MNDFVKHRYITILAALLLTAAVLVSCGAQESVSEPPEPSSESSVSSSEPEPPPSSALESSAPQTSASAETSSVPESAESSEASSAPETTESSEAPESAAPPAESSAAIPVTEAPSAAPQAASNYHQWTAGSAPASVRELYDAINYYRAENGLAALAYVSEIQYAADTRAAEAASYWSHTRPDGRADHTILDDMGISNYHVYGENLSKFDASYAVSQALTLWKDSPTHNENLLRDAFTGMCIGVYGSGGETYCSLLLV